MANTGMLYSRTRLAATSSCVESGFEAQSTTSAPPSPKRNRELAVSAVTCRQAKYELPAGLILDKFLADNLENFHRLISQSMRFFPMSASSRL